jgi:hypothetical protein
MGHGAWSMDPGNMGQGSGERRAEGRKRREKGRQGEGVIEKCLKIKMLKMPQNKTINSYNHLKFSSLTV